MGTYMPIAHAQKNLSLNALLTLCLTHVYTHIKRINTQAEGPPATGAEVSALCTQGHKTRVESVQLSRLWHPLCTTVAFWQSVYVSWNPSDCVSTTAALHPSDGSSAVGFPEEMTSTTAVGNGLGDRKVADRRLMGHTASCEKGCKPQKDDLLL